MNAFSFDLVSVARLNEGDVFREVAKVAAGAGLAGVAEVSKCPWIEVREIRHPAALEEIRSRRLTLGLGELSAMILARELAADLVLLDDLAPASLRKNRA